MRFSCELSLWAAFFLTNCTGDLNIKNYTLQVPEGNTVENFPMTQNSETIMENTDTISNINTKKCFMTEKNLPYDKQKDKHKAIIWNLYPLHKMSF
jgi:hypothetical protein